MDGRGVGKFWVLQGIGSGMRGIWEKWGKVGEVWGSEGKCWGRCEKVWEIGVEKCEGVWRSVGGGVRCVEKCGER